MTTTCPPTIPKPWLRSGYEKSVAAFLEATKSRDEEASYHALFSALNFAASIRDLFVDDEPQHPLMRIGR